MCKLCLKLNSGQESPREEWNGVAKRIAWSLFGTDKVGTDGFESIQHLRDPTNVVGRPKYAKLHGQIMLRSKEYSALTTSESGTSHLMYAGFPGDLAYGHDDYEYVRAGSVESVGEVPGLSHQMPVPNPDKVGEITAQSLGRIPTDLPRQKHAAAGWAKRKEVLLGCVDSRGARRDTRGRDADSDALLGTMPATPPCILTWGPEGAGDWARSPSAPHRPHPNRARAHASGNGGRDYVGVCEGGGHRVRTGDTVRARGSKRAWEWEWRREARQHMPHSSGLRVNALTRRGGSKLAVWSGKLEYRVSSMSRASAWGGDLVAHLDLSVVGFEVMLPRFLFPQVLGSNNRWLQSICAWRTSTRSLAESAQWGKAGGESIPRHGPGSGEASTEATLNRASAKEERKRKKTRGGGSGEKNHTVDVGPTSADRRF
ncbi:hypothetical protein DFH07DRAFT_769436 [Mycena maculata]|uniref:Uncharacterized protein n=1 Tax=Mycena maculata TaxID=230809 RepID=A0AAD7NNR2_9AGAR|nr:hypothetical protein DFH07DRAFT_769436 [Mycena maculata]